MIIYLEKPREIITKLIQTMKELNKVAEYISPTINGLHIYEQ